MSAQRPALTADIITEEITVLDSDGARTDQVIATVGATGRIIVTECTAHCSADNSSDIAVRVGVATGALPAGTLGGTLGIALSAHRLRPDSSISRGDGSGIILIGALNEDLKYTCGDPTNGELRIIVSYFTILEA